MARIKWLVSQKDQENLIHALISSRVDYSYDLLTGVPQKIIKQLQLIQVLLLECYPVPREQSTLLQYYIFYTGFQLVSEYILKFKKCCYYKSLNGLGREYISDMLTAKLYWRAYL